MLLDKPSSGQRDRPFCAPELVISLQRPKDLIAAKEYKESYPQIRTTRFGFQSDWGVRDRRKGYPFSPVPWSALNGNLGNPCNLRIFQFIAIFCGYQNVLVFLRVSVVNPF